jgi:class 3 adenylate cyclase
MRLARAISEPTLLVEIYHELQELYALQNNSDSTIKYLDLYARTKDSLGTIERVEKEKVRAERENIDKQKEIELQEKALALKTLRVRALAGGLGLFVLLSGGIFYQYRQAKKARNRARLEHQRSEELLLNILPAETAQELKYQGKTVARHYDNVTILFADIKGFTRLSEELPPDKLVDLLNTYFEAFDNIMAQYGLEKIKTIGDAYLAVGRLPDGNTASPQHVVRAALAMQEFAQKQIPKNEAQGTPPFAFRIGIHTGPVVAGVVGIKKFQYDIWGDTVNMAARMEQSGESGKVNISENTYRLISKDFVCVHRGKVAAKNKGEVDMYFVERPKRKARRKRVTDGPKEEE